MNPRDRFLIFLSIFSVLSCGQKEGSSDHLSAGTTTSTEPSVFVNSQGISVPTGTPVTINGQKIGLHEVTRRDVPAGPPRQVALPREARQLPVVQNTYPISIESLQNSAPPSPQKIEFAYPTGIPVPARGHSVTCPQPIPVAASLPVFRDNATRNIKYLDQGQGMNSSRVNAMLEDTRGNLWFGTHGGGISKYDGARFTHYTSAENLQDDIITAIIEDRKGNLWLATWTSGVTKFDGVGFTNYAQENGLINQEIKAIYEDKAGNIWLGTFQGGLCKYDGEHFTHFTTTEGLSSNSVQAILEDRHGNMWIGTADGGVNRYDGKNFYTITTEQGLGSNTVMAIIESRNGDIWLGTNGGGLSKFDGQYLTNYAIREGLNDDAILSLYEDNTGLLWIGTESGGVNIFDGERFTYLTMEEGLSDNTVTSITADHKGGLWFGTRDGGVNIYNRNSFVSFPGLSELNGGNVRSIVEDRQGDFWLATWGGGIIRYDGASLYQYTAREGIGDNTVWAMEEDQNGDLWFGTRFSGLGKYDGRNFTRFFEFADLAQFGIFSILEDRKGHLWFGTDGQGLFRYGGEHFTQYSTKEGFTANRLWSITERTNGDLCFATWGGGLGIYDGRDFTFYTENEGLISNDVWSVLEDSRGHLWLGTYGGGVSVFDGENFFHITTDNGLPSNIVNSIFQDDDENIWLGTEKGLVQVSVAPGQLLKADQGNYLHDSLFTIVSYSTFDGLIAQDFNVHSGLLDSRDRFWLGTGKGLVTLDLRDFDFPKGVPDLYLNHIEVNGQHIDYHNRNDSLDQAIAYSSATPFFNLPSTLRLSHNHNHLTFYFSSLDYEEQHDIEYSYKIPELNAQWSKPSSETKADYQNIPHGNYTFQVRVRGKSMIWSDTLSYAFTISPPWWETWWAYALYALAGLLLLTGFYLYQRRQWQLQTRWQLEWERAERLKEMDQFKSRFYTNITHEFRTPLTVIKGMADEIREPEKIKGLIRRNAERLLNMVNQLLDLSKLESNSLAINWIQADIIPFLRYLTESCHSLAERQQTNLAFFSKEEALVMDFDENKMQQILINLLSNAVKFTPAYGTIKVFVGKVVQEGKPFLEIMVEDTGSGIPEDKLPFIFDRFYQADNSAIRRGEGSGIGLALVRELVHLLEGRIEVDSREGVGTKFLVYLPIHQNADRVQEISPNLAGEGLPVANGAETVERQPPINDSKEKPLVLVIEDNADVREYIFTCLETDYVLEAAQNGREGVEKALEQIPDVILCDVMMPEMDGFEVCRQLKTDRRSSHIPVILLTAKATQEDKVLGLSQGADAYLTKPFDKAELMVRLQNLAMQSRRLRERLTDLKLPEEQLSEQEKQEAEFLSEIHQVIEDNLENELFKVDYLCKAMALSRAQMYRKLSALTGQSTAEYIRSYRLKKARKLLLSTNMLIGEIALEVGYKDFSHFTRSFVKEFGEKPSDIRG